MGFSGKPFDGSTLKLMEQVFDEVCAQAQHLTPSEAWPDDVASAVAIRILAAVSEGERDEERLRRWAFNAIDAHHFQAPGKQA